MNFVVCIKIIFLTKMPYTKLCKKWHNDRREEKEREKDLLGSVSAINLVCLMMCESVFIMPG